MLGISIGIWVILGMYVFSAIKKTYDKGGTFTNDLLVIWYIMWGFHHLPVVLSSLYGVWQLPINRTLALAGGLVIFIVGAVILAVGMIEFRSLRRATGQDISQLVTTGIYRRSRNPQFIGWFLVLLGISLVGRSGLAFILTAVFTIVIHLYTIWMEEPYLERIFGEEYRCYKSRTARWIGMQKTGRRCSARRPG
ncbi:MAG: isoprenylcysteine carboxylmethyltransferase family protein [Euryarchaeota archaeon]|nr:isoprenylcysteine carboxylmethyltransferase family protein [Euryarchaeota archaeon]